MSTHVTLLQTQESLRGLGVDYTVLRSSVDVDNIQVHLGSRREELPYHPGYPSTVNLVLGIVHDHRLRVLEVTFGFLFRGCIGTVSP